MNRTQIYLTTAEVEGVAQIATQSGRNQSEVIREAIDQYLVRLGHRDRLSRLRSACGIWEDREISLADLRDNTDRF